LHVACEWNYIGLIEEMYRVGGKELVEIKNLDGMNAIEFSYSEN
jgi:hypothetical protein